MSEQDQHVKPGGMGLQAGRDIVVQGVSPEQMTEIMVAIAKTAATFAKEALEIADARMSGFREEVLKMFSEKGKGDPEAFKDPDFQYLLGDAQEAVARSGDKAVRDTLVDIIALRSLEKGRTRLSITLGEAATIAAKLTENEFATLTLTYLVRYTIDRGIANLPALGSYIQNKLMPFARLVSREQSSFWHLQAQSCANVEMGQVDLMHVLRKQYGGVLGDGFTREQLESHLPDGKKHALDPFIIPCINDPSKLQPNALNFETLKKEAAGSGLTEPELENVWRLFENAMREPRLTEVAPDTPLLLELWKSTPLKNLALTSVGIAIAHANAARVIGFDAPINIWIK
jgi:hypothetical protein